MADEPKKGRKKRPLAEAVAEATEAASPVAPRGKRPKRGGRPSDALGGDIRRRDIFPLLVLHLVATEPAYGNRLIEAIEEMTQGVISVNPNTMYPLLRTMERDGFIEGQWELPGPAHPPLLLDHPGGKGSTSACSPRSSPSSTR